MTMEQIKAFQAYMESQIARNREQMRSLEEGSPQWNLYAGRIEAYCNSQQWIFTYTSDTDTGENSLQVEDLDDGS